MDDVLSWDFFFLCLFLFGFGQFNYWRGIRYGRKHR